MKMLVYRRCRIPGQNPLELHEARSPHGRQALEGLQKLLLPLRADARDPIQLRKLKPLAAQLAVVGDGKAVCLLLNIADQRKNCLIVVNSDLLPLRGPRARVR